MTSLGRGGDPVDLQRGHPALFVLRVDAAVDLQAEPGDVGCIQRRGIRHQTTAVVEGEGVERYRHRGQLTRRHLSERGGGGVGQRGA